MRGLPATAGAASNSPSPGATPAVLGAATDPRERPAWAPAPAPGFAEGEFDQWRRLIEARAGLAFTAAREPWLRGVLAERLRALDLGSYEQYYRRMLSGPEGPVEWHRLLDRLAIGETRFFRDPATFAYVQRLLRARVRAQGRAGQGHPLGLWSAGCSTGEEAWSLAMIADEVTQGVHGPGFAVWGTDLSALSIRRARRGCYSEARLDALDPERRRRHVEGEAGGERGRVAARLRARVCFARANLLDPPPSELADLDLIVCQNVLIYFRRWRRRELLAGLAGRLAPGGALLIGPGDVADWVPPGCERARTGDVLAFIRSPGCSAQESDPNG